PPPITKSERFPLRSPRFAAQLLVCLIRSKSSSLMMHLPMRRQKSHSKPAPESSRSVDAKSRPPETPEQAPHGVNICSSLTPIHGSTGSTLPKRWELSERVTPEAARGE